MKKTLHHLIRHIGLLTCLLLTAFPAAAAGEQVVEITVAKQATLIGLCTQYLENPAIWRQIARRNKLADPDLIFPGQRIKVPISMLKGMTLEGTVTLLKGTALRKSAGEEEWKPLMLHEALKVGTAIKTAKDSSVEITFEDGTSFLIRENSELAVVTAKKGALHLLRSLYLKSGKVISRIKSATGRDSRFEIETPSALAAARGTEYRVAVDNENNPRVEALENSIDLSAADTTLMLHEGHGSIIRMNEAPTEPTRLLAPPEPQNIAALYGDRISVISFSGVQDAVRYNVFLTQDPAGRQVVRTADITPDEQFRFEGLDDGSYYLFASSTGRDGLEGALSGPQEIKVRRKPFPPTLVAPAEHAALPEMPLKIQWHHVLGAAAYQIQIAKNPDFSGPLVESGDLRKTVYTAQDLSAGSYYLRARSLAEDGYAGDWSEVREFSVVPLAPPSLRKPDADDNALYIEWEPLKDAAGYHLQIARDEAFSDIILDRRLAETKLVLENPPDPGKYYMRVAAVSSGQEASRFSRSGSFEIEKQKHYLYEALGVAGGVVLLLLLL